MKFAVTSRIRNGHLWHAAELKGGIKPLSEYLGLEYTHLVSLINLRVFPSYKNPKSKIDWKSVEEKLLVLIGKDLGQVFPKELEHSEFILAPKVGTAFVEVETVSIGDIKNNLMLPPAQDSEISKLELEQKIKDILEELTPRQSEIIAFRFGLFGKEEMTLEEIAEMYKVSPERIRQVECRALARLRCRPLTKTLKAFHIDS